MAAGAITSAWIWIAINPDGTEDICSYRMPDGCLMPLMSSDIGTVQGLELYARIYARNTAAKSCSGASMRHSFAGTEPAPGL
jgi:hypothetical protein